ncbi:MAG TPA: phosphomannomutase/phosphoglucomutase, partial [Gammaproteobacteria bacterium]|nr:phosphomannomutase/phosphoglucomutase [Gammaproteobacteria bacterium]
VKYTQHLLPFIQALGGEAIMHPTGHSLIKAKMRGTGALLAGEMSGHFFFKERWYGFDDACYAGARLLEILANDTKNRKAQEIFSCLPNSLSTPELQVPIDDEKKHDFIQRLQQRSFDAKVVMLDGLRVEYSDGWGLVRASNTSPCLVLRFEAGSQGALSKIQRLFKAAILSIDASLTLPF